MRQEHLDALKWLYEDLEWLTTYPRSRRRLDDQIQHHKILVARIYEEAWMDNAHAEALGMNEAWDFEKSAAKHAMKCDLCDIRPWTRHKYIAGTETFFCDECSEAK
jgi:hypothetical protein